jgi:hypothetical protein
MSPIAHRTMPFSLLTAGQLRSAVRRAFAQRLKQNQWIVLRALSAPRKTGVYANAVTRALEQPARRGVREHPIERMRGREISVSDLNQLRLWVETRPEVPESECL